MLRPGHDRRAHLRHAAHRRRLRRLPRLARDLPPVVVQPRRHQRLLRDVDGRGAGDLLHPPPAQPEERQEQHDAEATRAGWSGCRTSAATTTAPTAMYGTIGRGENGPIVQEMPKFGHLVNLFSIVLRQGRQGRRHDRGPPRPRPASSTSSACVSRKYRYRVIRVADLQRELEELAARQTDGTSSSPLAVRPRPDATGRSSRSSRRELPTARCAGVSGRAPGRATPCHAAVDRRGPPEGRVRRADDARLLLRGGDGYPVRVPVVPSSGAVTDDPRRVPPARSSRSARPAARRGRAARPAGAGGRRPRPGAASTPTRRTTTGRPRSAPTLTPLYTFLEETDLTNAYDSGTYRRAVDVRPGVHGRLVHADRRCSGRGSASTDPGVHRRGLRRLPHRLPRRGRRGRRLSGTTSA